MIGYLNGERALYRKSFIITFDDGYKDNYIYAYPILKKYNVPATIFLTTGHIGTTKPFWQNKLAYIIRKTNRDSIEIEGFGKYQLYTQQERSRAIIHIKNKLKTLRHEEIQTQIEEMESLLDVKALYSLPEDLFLDWDNVREMANYGIDFGAHGITHAQMTKINLEQARNEISLSKKKIEDEIGRPVTSFSYPNGDFDEDIKQILQDEGFTCGISTRRGTCNTKSDRWELKRIGVEKQTFYEFTFDVDPIINKLKNKLRNSQC